MKAIIKLGALALAGASIAAGIAVAQPNAGTEATMNPDTANYGTPPGAPLKRDGSLSASGAATGTVTDTRSSQTRVEDNSTSTSSTTSSANNPPATDTTTRQSSSSSSLSPRADRN